MKRVICLTPALADPEAQLQKEIGAFGINAEARCACARFMNYAIGECELTMCEGGMAGQARRDGIGERFDAAMDPEVPADAFLIEAVDDCVSALGLDKDGLLKALMDALRLEADESAVNARYYTLIDIRALAERAYGADFRDLLQGEKMEIARRLFELLDENCAESGLELANAA